MPSLPSVSRDKTTGFGFYDEDTTDCASILGKRGWGSGDDAMNQPDAKRRTTQNLPSSSAIAERPDDASSTWSGSDEDEGEKLELESKTKQAKESFLPTSIPDSKQELSCNGSDALLKRKHVFASRRIFRRHSIATPYTKDVYKIDTGGNYHEYNVLGTKCDSQLRRCGFPTVYRISCSAKDSKHHATFLYEDDPVQAVFTGQRQTSHLSGNKPIYQFRDYVNRFEQSSWVIVKNRTCNNQIAQSHQQERYKENMIILSEELRQVIHRVATCPLDVPGGKSLGKDELLEMEAPYLFLYNHRQPLRVHSQSATASLRNMIDSVLEYLDRNYAQAYEEAEQLISKGMITIRHLEKLYRPNQLLVRKSFPGEDNLESQNMRVLQGWAWVRNAEVRLSLWNWQSNGFICERKLSPNFFFDVPVENEAEPFHINELFYYPISFLSEESIELFRQRGKAFWSLLHPNFVSIDNFRVRNHKDYVKPGRYMIDCEMHERLHRNGSQVLGPEIIRNKQIDPWRLELVHPNDEPEADEFLMMPAHIPGYDFLEKEWVDLPVSRVKPVKWNKQPFEDLVLDEATKHLVKALVTIRASSIKRKGEDTNFDIISGKGNGLIMLFHGSPGTGKTLTAESVAEIAEMPLYPITCGDIGTEPEKVEQYLQLVFQLGKRWNCVLLLDEADVFLEERTLTDLQRNSLVSVFLRMLEYYEGILILTSNRVGTFDEAFRSRIHIALHYEDLKPRSRKQIWSNFLTRLEDTDEGENVDQIKDRLDELAKHDLNGREIRNALSTARQLASHEGEKMRWKHLELAIKTTNNFGNYLRNVHGHSDREWAKEAGKR
ncbi:hypothetical protein BP6252_10315 [Coleophoma cylindrospora]|uniref:AAA+ ATPase domain-containing protein n=1 Tax=Coleophoma cylindrospora TaxID=1849047 RepID=A0A3D8QT28_9HELO|nr:hypothetical protein BP6252_10315 [Coleophoma cylindrospora]